MRPVRELRIQYQSFLHGQRLYPGALAAYRVERVREPPQGPDHASLSSLFVGLATAEGLLPVRRQDNPEAPLLFRLVLAPVQLCHSASPKQSKGTVGTRLVCVKGSATKGLSRHSFPPWRQQRGRRVGYNPPGRGWLSGSSDLAPECPVRTCTRSRTYAKDVSQCQVPFEARREQENNPAELTTYAAIAVVHCHKRSPGQTHCQALAASSPTQARRRLE